MNQEAINGLLYVILAGSLASIISFPPNVPSYIIQLYDYPILRVIVLTIISGIGLYIPEVALLLAVGYGIIGEDIIKSASVRANSRIKLGAVGGDNSRIKLGAVGGDNSRIKLGAVGGDNPRNEGFKANQEEKLINLLPGPTDMLESKEIVSRKTASLDGIQNTLRSLQIQIQSMLPKSETR
jgi:hypothetical protein